ncbi:MAG: hypothetical protein IH946_09160 [Bacteroidetes bacterium]|nr:hypothetical protein [Bacteroidota bacterium]
MKQIEKVLLAITAISGILYKTILFDSYLGYILGFTALAIYYMVTQEKGLYSIVLLLLVFVLPGAFFKSMHWPGGGVMLMLGMLGEGLFAVLLLREGLLQQRYPSFKFMTWIGLAIAAQLISILIGQYRFQLYAKYINYLIVGLIVNHKVTAVQNHPVAEKIFNLLLITASMQIIEHSKNLWRFLL